MLLACLLVCADEAATEVLRRILKELDIDVEHCIEPAAVPQKLKESRFDAVIVDCEKFESAAETLRKTRTSSLNGTALIIALVHSQDNVRPVFAAGANFVLYKPISPERARGSLQAARGLMRRERRRSTRVPVYATAGIAYPGVEEGKATLIDLSEEGTAIQCEQPLPPKGKVYFQFTLPGHKELVRLAGEVVWQDSTGRVGLRFADVPQSSRRLLKLWLQHNIFRRLESGLHDPGSSAGATPQSKKAAAKTGAEPADGLARFRATPGNRRGQSRHACRLGAEVYRLGKTVPNRCNLSDIGVGGCYVEMPSPFESETPVEILVRTRDLKIRTRGVVQSVHPGFGMGVKFNPRTEREHDQIQQLISLLRSQQELDPRLP